MSCLISQGKALKKHRATTIKRKAATRKFGTRLASRTKRVAATSIVAIPAESIPFLGVSVLIAGTVYELYEACQSIKDLDQTYLDMGMEDETPDDVLRSVCNPILPEPAQVWGGVVDQVDRWWESLVEAV